MQIFADCRRCSRPLCSSQETDGTSPPRSTSTPHRNPGRCHAEVTSQRLLPQDPTVCSPSSPKGRPRSAAPRTGSVLAGPPPGTRVNSQCSTSEQWTPARTFASRRCQRLLRKEVIQPHLPVRLPCYDFVPIADPTFDDSLPYGLGRRLRVLPTFVT
jgi:hypothetical protein